MLQGFRFLHGLAGLIGGFVIVFIGALWFSSAQYIYPTQASLAMGLTLLGLGLVVLAPAWYWVGRPVWVRFGSDEGS